MKKRLPRLPRGKKRGWTAGKKGEIKASKLEGKNAKGAQIRKPA